ncbi:MAG: glutamate synthase [Phycisphaerae bacterium]|nr:glutamate synthase [Phycisphaerae bacterium]
MSQHKIEKLLRSRQLLIQDMDIPRTVKKEAEEGGCGVVGFCCTEPVAGRHIYEPSFQMHNRGNGKGGGIAAVGFVPEELGVTREVLDDHLMLHVAFLDNSVRQALEATYITAHLDVAHTAQLDTVENWKTVPGLENRPPDVRRYFVRVKPKVLDAFIAANDLGSLDRRDAEDEFVNQNSFKLNQEYYASMGQQQAFVLSHGRDIMILKVVGYAEAIVKYYKIEDLKAHVWIAHQRFPTKGRVWHPGGAHPFAGMNMALVHNGDFANYHSVSESLMQRHIAPQFLTDTEVAALSFDLFDRTYEYPLEYIIEALAPTTELDFDRLPPEKQTIYRALQATHIHSSPDGPWFFILARNIVRSQQFQLLGITDTAMLRPQVFAFLDGDVQVGLIASEKQAIDATLQSLAKDDPRICPVADRYWNARGGSHTDGGAFMFNLEKDARGRRRMACADKFGRPVDMPKQTDACDFTLNVTSLDRHPEITKPISEAMDQGALAVFAHIRDHMASWSFDEFRVACRVLGDQADKPKTIQSAIDALTLLHDRKYATGAKKASHVKFLVHGELVRLFKRVPGLPAQADPDTRHRFIDFETRDTLRAPRRHETTLVIDASGFTPEGQDCDAALLVDAYRLGWRRFIPINCRGQRYIGCGLGPETSDVFIEVYGSSGDYLASGIDGLSITVHGNAQDQLAQIIKTGKLVIHGDVGQTFMYGAKGGSVYVLGNAAGRPLVNSVGRPRVVINGTCLDFLAESFMAGDPLNGGGFVILNGIEIDANGHVEPLLEPYSGSNLFSLASGGAIYVRDPHSYLVDQQLNGGEFKELTAQDWEVMLPYLQENEQLFDIPVTELLTVDGTERPPEKVYRKVIPVKNKALISKVEFTLEDDDASNMTPESLVQSPKS